MRELEEGKTLQIQSETEIGFSCKWILKNKRTEPSNKNRNTTAETPTKPPPGLLFSSLLSKPSVGGFAFFIKVTHADSVVMETRTEPHHRIKRNPR
ncbi:hypothetical protein QQF64_018252 [Cirrhinus molitorella]|uniref:Uncharacterized protein n=1 Tax=Cirrhinus molitorella TaxID=172907 RepID=A0ABR3LPE7_9TELE